VTENLSKANTIKTHTHKQGKPNRKPSIFFIISRKFSSGSKIKPWPFRFLREWILPESQALETPEGKLP